MISPDHRPDTLFRELLERAQAMTLANVGEKALLRDFILPLCRAICQDHGLGDDAGVMKPKDQIDVVATTDRVPADLLPLQFGLMTAEELGSYLVRVNISDLAAMGADPLAMVIACGFESQTAVRHVLRLMYGIYTASVEFSCPVIGGDTKTSREQSLSATAIGTVPTGRAVRRGPVVPGMSVFLSGSVGHAGAALRWFARGDERAQHLAERQDLVAADLRLRQRLVSPRPRNDLATAIRDAGCAAAMDITDGLGQSLIELGEQSGVGFVLRESSIRFDAATVAVSEVLGVSLRRIIGGIGLDLELVVIAENNPAPSEFYSIGEVVPDQTGVWFTDGSALQVEGFEHFSRDATKYLEGDRIVPG